MSAVYADRTDLDDFGGLPDGALSNAGRTVARVYAATDVFNLAAHGLVTDEAVGVRAVEDGTLPAPLVEGTYFAIRLTDDTFKLASVPGGAAVNLTQDGTNVVITKPLPIDRMLELYSRWVDDLLPGHLVPLVADKVTGRYPIVVTRLVAQLAGKALLNRDGKLSAVVDAAELAAKAQLERFAAGIPLRDAGMTPSANRAVTSFIGLAPDPRGWGSGTLP